MNTGDENTCFICIKKDELFVMVHLRSVCRLFTIDPPTARDLDDALSIEDLGNGNWRVGVHIADVSFFIPPGSALDKKAADRATSTYMIQEVVHMLPRLLCEELCSLNAGNTLFSDIKKVFNRDLHVIHHL